MCSTFHHYIVYNLKGINTNEWLLLLTIIIINTKIISQ